MTGEIMERYGFKVQFRKHNIIKYVIKSKLGMVRHNVRKWENVSLSVSVLVSKSQYTEISLMVVGIKVIS